ncbi:hypothetical protein BTO04_03380 [Polaribacter sp. SA4-10]|uniref:OmpA family protein n=1 Tax=Polaribacter sp. SA4-10 TaxID=754397 RepID=UPI000B55F9FA|nr:OmpA family protein [Polaribacter sp. SA4-10]ARV05798.1 hypothetical protein BTO04_03380 [Polaribacter sp. SA4-10]
MYSQNLVRNGSFEESKVCPPLKNAPIIADGWKNAGLGSSDRYTKKCLDNNKPNPLFGVPKNGHGISEPKEGISYAGLFLYTQPQVWREYIQTALKRPLISKTNYLISFYYRLSSKSAYACENLSMALTTNAIRQVKTMPISFKPQINITKGNASNHNKGWQYYEEIYEANGGERFITIGNFESRNAIEIQKINRSTFPKDVLKNGLIKGAYYYFDDVVIQRIQEAVASSFEINKVLKFEWVYFKTDKSVINEKGTNELKVLSNYLSANPQLKIKIMAHTDNVGSDNYNLELSQKRAMIVVHFLIASGISKNRIISEYYGESKPIESNNSGKGKALNRRTEYILHY